MSSTGLGKKLGELYESIPTRIWGLKISNLIFCPILIPVSLALYFVLKIFWRALHAHQSKRAVLEIARKSKGFRGFLNDVTAVQVYQGAGDLFYKAGDIYLVGKGGEHLMVLRGSPPLTFSKGRLKRHGTPAQWLQLLSTRSNPGADSPRDSFAVSSYSRTSPRLVPLFFALFVVRISSSHRVIDF